MHKGIILLTTAEDKKQAQTKVRSFMDSYCNDVWDWWVFGGRWSKTLNPITAKFKDEAIQYMLNEKSGQKFDKTIFNSDIEKHSGYLQALWENMGGVGNNPFVVDTYKVAGTKDDVMDLSQCIEVVEDWKFNTLEKVNELREEAERWMNGEYADNDTSMYEYMSEKIKKLANEEFCFDCNIYNIETDNYEIPEDTNGWFAVMIDIHN